MSSLTVSVVFIGMDQIESAFAKWIKDFISFNDF